MSLIVLAIIILLWLFRPRLTVSSTRLLAPAPQSLLSRSRLQFWLPAAAAFFAALACDNPAIPWHSPDTRPATLNLAIVLDLSGSMEASDWPDNTPLPQHPDFRQPPPSRLDTARTHIRRLLDECPHTRTLLLAFAANTVLVAPLADDDAILRQRLDSLSPYQFTDGTAIGQAVAAAVRSLRHAPDGPRTIVVFSDGVDHTSTQIPPTQAAELARRENIVVHACGIGGSHAFHPVSTDTGIRWEPVGEPFDLAQLTALAAATGGQAFPARDADALAAAVNAIRDRLHQQSAAATIPDRLPLAPWLLALAVILTIAAFHVNRM